MRELFRAIFIALVVTLEAAFVYLFLMLVWVSHAKASFNPEVLSLSTVRIVVKSGGQVTSVASGFVWKDDKSIVTSLHVLGADPNATVIVEFGKKRRKAKIKSILPEADLVLLEVSRPLKEWSALNTFEPEAPEYKASVTALGFNMGALGMSTRELMKGYAKPEILQQLLPGRAAKILAKTQMPSVTLPIYYLDGSLLPGYSGSPIVNAKGELIGVGNGGLESGASSVSWVIPADNLSALEASSIHELPASTKYSSKLFTLDKVTTGQAGAYWFTPSESALALSPLKPNSIDSVLRQVNAFDAEAVLSSTLSSHAQLIEGVEETLSYQLPVSAQYQEVNYQGFHFVKVKTRSYHDMLASSGNPQSIASALVLFQHFFPDYRIDYSSQQFSVYTDAHYGLNLILPESVKLVVEDGFLLAKSELLCRTCAYEIQYHARVVKPKIQAIIQRNAEGFLQRVAAQHWNDLNAEGDYQEYPNFRQIEPYGSGRYVLRAAFSDFDEPFKDSFELNYFIAAHNRETWFQVQGIVNRFDADFLQKIEKYKGTDCTSGHLNPEQTQLCDDVLMAFNVLASTHFTSFSNQIFSSLAAPLSALAAE
ncbi:S1 family peptidase [Alteromonas sp. a30]|uniref:S1 family peptidase n=1 Tax=Alteromonas sp. a30 TaxID=2730917 RepID=UPI002282C21B|nr:serine protease [Alteromonas sp. a30]MCY7296508.1 trypsin-like peptidase domain-containing protein [Alteromonas sp. a30]